MVEGSHFSEMVGEGLEIGVDGSVKPVGEVTSVSDAGEGPLGDDVGAGDGNGEGHDVVKVVGLDVALLVKVAGFEQPTSLG